MTDRQAPPAAIVPSAFEPLDPNSQSKGPQRNPLRLLVALVAALTVAILWFLFTARSVEIRIDALGDSDLDIDGGLVVPLGQRLLMRSGEYRLRVETEGYHPLAATLDVGAESSQSFTFTPLPLPGILEIDSQPGGALVYLDGEQLGKTPLEVPGIEAGEHQLRIERERYLGVAQALQVTGRLQRQHLSYALQPAWADIEVATLPAGASILVDGEPAGLTPAVTPLLQGERQLILRLAGFADHQQVLDVVAGEAQSLGTIELQPAAGIVRLSSRPSRANVTVDGEFAGQTPLTLELEPGISHRLSLSRAGYRRASRTLELAAGSEQEMAITLKAQLGKVDIRVTPAAATVRVDGRDMGNGSQLLQLPAYEHTISVELPGYAPFRQRFTPRPGLQQVIDVSLQTEEEAIMARITPEVTTSLGQKMKLFRGGEFTMGASRREPGRKSNEVLRPVALRRMFYLATTEVTNAQFRLFDASHNSGQVQGNSMNREDQPVVRVSWQQAAQFANWLSREEGLTPFYTENAGIITGFKPAATGYRLPSEAEWAFAARVRGEQVLRYPWGDEFPPPKPVENYADQGSAYVTGRFISGYNDSAVVTSNVGTYPANHHGIHDLGGNVAEWVHDIYSIDAGSSSTAVDPLGAQSGDNYTIRGSSWAHGKVSELRLSYRDYGERGRDDVGFRLARYAE
jgi:formylglycine-generating enzyme required for sulfatase activity